MKTTLLILLLLYSLPCAFSQTKGTEDSGKKTTATTNSAAAATGEVSPNYRLSTGDKVKITVFDEPDLLTEQEIDGDGRISLPLIGDVKVGSRTASEAERAIELSYKENELLKRPQVSLAVIDYAKRQVSILGEVANPGLVTIASGQTKIELLQAVAGAGGFKGIAQKKKVSITRKGGRKETVSAYDLERGNLKQPVYLYPGDVVFVPQRII